MTSSASLSRPGTPDSVSPGKRKSLLARSQASSLRDIDSLALESLIMASGEYISHDTELELREGLPPKTAKFKTYAKSLLSIPLRTLYPDMDIYLEFFIF